MQRRTEERLRKEENSQIKGKKGETKSKEEREAKLRNIFNLFAKLNQLGPHSI